MALPLAKGGFCLMIKKDEQLTRLDDYSFVVPMAWMRTKLHLTGAHLWAYAVIFGFSHDGESWFYGSRSYIAEWAGVDKTTVSRALKDLTDAGLIERKDVNRNGVIFPIYRAKMFQKNAQGVCTMPTGVCTMPTNNIDNNIDNLTNTNVLDKGDNVASEPVNKSNSQKVAKTAGPDSKPSYGNSTINSMFDYWRQCVGTPIISREKGNRRACYNLLRNKHIGEEKLRHAIEFVGEIKEDRFAPRISDFVDLQSKFNELCAFKTKYQAQQDVSGDKTQNKAVSSAMKGYNSAGGNVEFVPWRPTAGDLEREREWQEKERRQTEESAKVDPEWLEKLKQETIRKIYNHGDNK